MSIPVSFNKDGSFRKNSSVASKEQFDILNRYVKTKISHIRQSIMTGDAQVSPYMMGKKMPVPTVLNHMIKCIDFYFDAVVSILAEKGVISLEEQYVDGSGVCGFDMDIPGYEFRRLKNFTDEELWDAFVKEVDE